MPFKVLITTPYPSWPLIRQISGQFAERNASLLTGQSDPPVLQSKLPQVACWDDWELHVNQPVDDADAWVVLDDLISPTTVRVSPGNTLLLTAEPPSIRSYRQSFLRQFAHVITCHPRLAQGGRWSHPHVYLSPPGLPWHIGVDRNNNDTVRLAHEDFKQPSVTKRGLISVICSNKSITRDHVARQQFVQHLREHYKSRIDIFGRGVREIGDKWDAIAPYYYHVVLENDTTPHFFSEKLTDCFLAGAYPIYYGCPNVTDYFPAASLSSIDIHQPAQAIAQIDQVIASKQAELQTAAVLASRDLVLEKYNVFSIVRDFIEKRLSLTSSSKSKQLVTFLPQCHKWRLRFSGASNLQRRFAL